MGELLMGETKIGRFDVEFDGHMFVLSDGEDFQSVFTYLDRAEAEALASISCLLQMKRINAEGN
jgi:hypothetical protein